MLLTPPPRLDLPGFMLRAWSAADAAPLRVALAASDAHLRRWTPWVVDGRVPGVGLEDRLARHAADFAAGTEWVYGLFSPDGTEVLGGCGMYPRVGPGALELGYWLAVGHTGRGLATRAVAALTRLAFVAPAVDHVEIRCDRGNEASARVPERLGYRITETPATNAPADLMVWRLSRAEFLRWTPDEAPSLGTSRPIMRRSLLRAVAAALALLPATTSAQSPSGKAPAPAFTDPARLEKLATAFPAIDSTMRAFAERAHVPGIAYGIVVDGRVVHRGTVGLRNLATHAPVDSASVFRIASMTKSFTALAILKLRDEGKLALDDPAERYVPELESLRYPTSDAPKITIRHLLTHSAGFPEDNPWGDQQLAATPEDLTRMLRRGVPFSTSPGTAYEYSNLGFAILGRIVANVSGMPYARYVKQQILDPLGMRVTTLETAQVPASRLALGYRRQDGQWLEEKQLPDGAFGSMGGMLTSIDDLGRWVGFMLDAWPPRNGVERGPVRRASAREMQQVARFNGATAARDTATNTLALSAGGYGYGLGVRTTCLFPTLVSHSGGLPGFGSIMRWLPEYGVGIVALGNLTYTSWGGPTSQALDLLARTGGLVPRAPRPAPVLVERRAQVTRLVSHWSDALADSLAAMNLYLDESKGRRRAAIEALRATAGGDCRDEGPMVAENALRGEWRIRCRNGDLRVSITLAPTEPAGVQFLEVAPVAREERLGAGPVCR